MAITQADWNAIWDSGFDAGYNKVHHTRHAVRPAPPAAELRIDAAAWNAVWNAGFQSAYGKRVAAPSPAGIATLAPGGAEAASAGGPAATVATVGRGGGGGAPGGGAFGYNADQWSNIYTVIKVGHDLHMSGPVIVSMLCLGYGENGFSSGGCNSSNHCGFFQLSGSLQSEHDFHDVAYWAKRAYLDGFYIMGLAAAARRYPNESPGYWTNLCQGAYSNLTQGAQYYDRGLPTANNLFNYWYPRISGGARAPASPGGQYTTVAPAHFSSPGGVTLEQVIRSENWAGDFEALWQHAQAGSDQAAGAAAAYLRNLQGHDYVTAH